MQQAFEYLTSKDPVFAKIIELYGPPFIPSRPQGFETLCKIIFEQQVSLESGKACFDKLNALVPKFTPENILACSEADFRACGLSRQKVKYITALADAIINSEIDIENLDQNTPEQIREELIKIKGIGNWTIDVYLMFSLQSPDIIPLADIGIKVTIKELWGIETPVEQKVLSDLWAPYRTAASFLLWHYYLRKRGRAIHM
ncbi:MAG TPA: DNA-3-methyladenine glycosylase 2 family protein [Flavobacterium sp.]|jgi:DNA-3-methyladenine glycosylase II